MLLTIIVLYLKNIWLLIWLITSESASFGSIDKRPVSPKCIRHAIDKLSGIIRLPATMARNVRLAIDGGGERLASMRMCVNEDRPDLNNPWI